MDKKENELIEKYQYKGEGELISDLSNVELSKKSDTKKTIKKKKQDKIFEKKEEKIVIQQEPLKTNKQMFNMLLLENKPFYLKYNGHVIFDSDNNSINNLGFQENFFSLFGKQYKYDGLVFKFKK